MTTTDVRPFGIDQAVPVVASNSQSVTHSTCTIEGLLTKDNDGGAGPFSPSSHAFPLGRPFGLVGQATPLNKGRMPFGLSIAVAPKPIAMGDLSRFSYDYTRQMGMVDVGGVAVPLMKHTTGTTRTSTNPDGQKGPDSDADARED